jgi:hypothetical protein
LTYTSCLGHTQFTVAIKTYNVFIALHNSVSKVFSNLNFKFNLKDTMRFTRLFILTLLILFIYSWFFFMHIQRGHITDRQTPQKIDRQTPQKIDRQTPQKIDRQTPQKIDSTLRYNRNSTQHLWRFYNKEIPSLYDAFTNGSTLIFIFQTKKGHCSRCVGEEVFGLPLIEYGVGGHKRTAAPRWECRLPAETVVGSVIRDPHGHIFVLLCPVIPSTKRVEVRAEAIGEESLVYTDIEYTKNRKKSAYRLAACTMVRSDASINELEEWVKYHIIQGWEHFSVYVDGPVDRFTEFWVNNETVSIVNWHWPDSGFQHQQAEMNSCLYRYRGSAEWVAFFDMDEFFQPMTTTIIDLLGKVPQEYGGWGARHVLFALPPSGTQGNLVTQTAVERSANALPFTVRSKCIVRPYEVDTMGVHEITSGNTRTWVADPDTEARLNHYRAGLEWDGGKVHDTSMQTYAIALQRSKSAVREPFVAVYLEGRLGNQLFQAASSFGIAQARGAVWCIPYLQGSRLAGSVRFTVKPMTDCVPEGVHVAHEGGDFLQFQEWMIHEHPGENMRIGTYLQSFRYFANVSILPFELLKQQWADEWVRDHGIIAGIHVRRTDMLENLGNDPTTAYFTKALSQMREAVGQIHAKNIVVCTDDPEWVHANEIFNGMDVQVNTDYEDMALLAACKHLILSIGSFGWWSAYMRASPGLTFYYAEPLRNPPSSYKEHFPASWTPIVLTQGDTVKQTCEVTLVTSYFQVPSKHSVEEYRAWINNTLSLRACFVIFTETPLKSLFLGLTEGREAYTDLSTVDLKKEAARLNRSLAFWEHQYSAVMDQEWAIHKGFELYWVWTLKSFFVRDAVEKNVFQSNYFFWIDIGYLRDSRFNGRALMGVPAQVKRAPHSVFMLVVVPFSAAEIELDQGGHAKHHLSSDHLVGGCWGGEARAVLRFHEAYKATFSRIADEGRFVGKDQTVFNTICVQTKDLCTLIQPGIFDPWFDMVPFLLDDTGKGP